MFDKVIDFLVDFPFHNWPFLNGALQVLVVYLVIMFLFGGK